MFRVSCIQLRSNNNIHQKASLYSSDEMLQSISGEKLNSKYYLEHLVGRFVK